MRMRGGPWLVLVILASGCVSPASPSGRSTGMLEEATLSGRVLDDEERPLEGAAVTLVPGNATSVTDPGGRFLLSRLPPGRVIVVVALVGYETLNASLHLPPGATHRDLRLSPLPRAMARSVPVHYRGDYDCAFELLILGGDCLVLYENVTGEQDPVTKETYVFRLRVGPNWSRVDLNLTWQSGADNQLDGMRFLLEHGNSSKTGHGTQVARSEGAANPLRIVVERGVPHPLADTYDGTGTKATIADAGEELQVRVHPRGKLAERGSLQCVGACWQGVGFGVDLTFTVDGAVLYSR